MKTSSCKRTKCSFRHKLLIISLTLAVLVTIHSFGAVAIYDSFFTRYERPDYSLYPGMYCYEQYENSLPRETFTVNSQDTELAAYYYPTEDPKGLVVTVHGFGSGADDYLPLIEAMVKGGYAVFTYDVTGNYSSGGESGIGMCQQLVDLDRILTYLSVNMPYAKMPKYLIGHSWGGYAALSVLKLHSEVKACVGIAPMCDATDIMVQTSKEYVGPLAYAVKPVFDIYQKHLFDTYVEYDAIDGINSTDIPILIAQGRADTRIPADTLSVTARLDEVTNPNLTLYYGEGVQGSHTGIWHSAEAMEYAAKVEEETKELNDTEKAEYYKNADHRLYSEVNAELIELIFETFEKSK